MAKATKKKRQAYVKLILKLLAAGTAGYLTGILAPHRSVKLVRELAKFSRQELAELRRTLQRLERQRLVEIVEKGEEIEIRLTLIGKRKAERLRLEDLTIDSPKKWDGKWRLVIFDVPEYLRLGRDALRSTLQRLGFYQIQKSVFVFPHPCEKEIKAVAKAFELEKHIHYFTVESMKPSYHLHLKKHFRPPVVRSSLLPQPVMEFYHDRGKTPFERGGGSGIKKTPRRCSAKNFYGFFF